jgi:hypothetical protein
MGKLHVAGYKDEKVACYRLQVARMGAGVLFLVTCVFDIYYDLLSGSLLIKPWIKREIPKENQNPNWFDARILRQYCFQLK